MARIKIDIPSSFSFTTRIPVRITDLNYGGHVGNDTLLGILQEARVHYLQQWGYTELNVGGAGLIMSDAAVTYKGESFYGDMLEISIQAAEFTRVGFELYYLVETLRGEKRIPVAQAKTGMVCFDYTARKPVQLPEAFLAQVKGGNVV
jgi:acyl-CoA thioester hydrolase